MLKLIAHNKINKCLWKIDRSEILFHSNFFDHLHFGRKGILGQKNCKVVDVTITETENWVESDALLSANIVSVGIIEMKVGRS